MTVAVSCNLPDGVVLGVDSAITMSNAQGQVVKVYENAQKLFQLSDSPIGISTFGLGSFGARSIGSYMANVNTRVETGPHSGRFKGYNYVVIGGFFLVPKEVEEIFLKVKAPSHTGKYEAIFVVASEQKTYKTKELELIIT